MSILLDGSLAQTLTDALIAHDLPYALTVRRTESNGDPFNPEQVTTDYAASGWVDDYAAQDVDGTLIRQTDRKAFVLCSSLDIDPSPTDRLVVSGATFTIISVQRDPAGACWVVQARK
jgi:hypothetical protein